MSTASQTPSPSPDASKVGACRANSPATSAADPHASATAFEFAGSIPQPHFARSVTPITTILNRPDKSIRDAKSVRGEMHNVLALMRRWARRDRFFREIPIQEESPIRRSFKLLHDHMQNVTDLNEVDTVTYLKPFLEAFADGGEVTGIFATIPEMSIHRHAFMSAMPNVNQGVALASVNKFLLYGVVNKRSRKVAQGMNEIICAIARCIPKPKLSDTYEIILFKMLELMLHCLRSDCGPFLTDDSVWTLFDACSKVSILTDISETLRHTAENTLAHVVLTIFCRTEELQNTSQSVGLSHPRVSDDSNDTEQHLRPYGTQVLLKVLKFLVSRTDPSRNDEDAVVLGLRLINIVLEMGGEALGSVPSLVQVMQTDLCKFLLQNSQTEELEILSLTLRVVYNLFNSIKTHLKVQLQVFFTSVHVRICSNTSSSAEQKELALESLLDFCQEPALMVDLYVNYDCDLGGTNLFENLCRCLCNSADPRDRGKLSILNLLAFDGIIAVLVAMRKRVDKAKVSLSPKPFRLKVKRANGEFYQRKLVKKRVATVVERFNSHPKDRDWLPLARELGVLEATIPTSGADAKTKEQVAIGRFLYRAPGVDKNVLGEYLGYWKSKDQQNANVLAGYTSEFNFNQLGFSDALRLFLESFRLPGESQKIDRMMQCFASHLFRQNPGPFVEADAPFVLAFATVMLNTNLHNPAMKKRMTLDEFAHQVQKINGGKDLPLKFVSDIYRGIKNKQIMVGAELDDTAGLADAWDSLLHKSASFNSAGFNHLSTADVGMHEREMFACVADDMLQVLLRVLQHTSLNSVMLKTLQAIFDFTLIAAFFDLSDAVNQVVCKLCKFFLQHSSEEEGAMAHSPTQLATTTTVREDMLCVDLSAKSARALRDLQLTFRIVHSFGEHLREAWINVITTMLDMLRQQILPQFLIDVNTSSGTTALFVAEANTDLDSGGLWDSLSSLWYTPSNEPPPRTAFKDEHDRSAVSTRQEVETFKIEKLFVDSHTFNGQSVQHMLQALVTVGNSPSIGAHMKGTSFSPRDPRARILCMRLLVLAACKNSAHVDMFWRSVSELFEGVVDGAQRSSTPVYGELQLGVDALFHFFTGSFLGEGRPTMLRLANTLNLVNKMGQKCLQACSCQVAMGMQSVAEALANVPDELDGSSELYQVAQQLLLRCAKSTEARTTVWNTLYEIATKGNVSRYVETIVSLGGKYNQESESLRVLSRYVCTVRPAHKADADAATLPRILVLRYIAKMFDSDRTGVAHHTAEVLERCILSPGWWIRACNSLQMIGARILVTKKIVTQCCVVYFSTPLFWARAGHCFQDNF